MRLTPFAKLFVTLVVLGVVGYTGWHYFGSEIRGWATDKPKEDGKKGDGTAATHGKGGGDAVGKTDFDDLQNAPPDPGKGGVTATAGAAITGGKLNRPLRVGINTWAGHAPGIVANGGLKQKIGSIYGKLGVDVELSIIDDPAAKFAAFQAGQIDVMWDTVDSWAREAGVLAEPGARTKGRAVIMEDWSRGGDGIVALASIKSVEDLAGKRVATTEFTPSHWLLLYLLNQSGLTVEQKREIEKNIIKTQDAPAAAAMFKSKQVDAAVTWEPDLSGAVTARGDEAHVLVSTTAATNVIADVLVARQEVIDQAPQTLGAFVAGWFEGIDAMKKDPAGTNAVIGDALKLDNETISGMLSGLKLTPFADTAQFFGLTAGKAHFETLFNTAFRIWRKMGVVSRAVDAKDHLETRFVAALADKYKGQQIVEAKLEARKPTAGDVPIINKTLSINFTPGSDEIMPGSYFTLDSLGETMISFGATYLRIEGNTDSTGSRTKNVEFSGKRAESVKNYLVKNFNLPPARFQTLGFGPDKPVAPNATESGRQLNRRTDIKVVLAAP